ncbi:hypothetical protein LCGC14_1461930 [marine sediment metagenome]|uniref:Uncharacterized protein n=1 Tax=marine sediment metagenome TaxID=412755 RepID=A0A0F9JFH0_9ZZZZ
MVTLNDEPWEVSTDTVGVHNVYDTEGKFIFEVDPGFSNITLEQLNRMVLCFNACTGIPDGALESAVEAGNNIWVSGYTAGIKQYAEQQE